MTSRTGSAQGILGDLKKTVSWVETRHRTRRVDFRGSQRPDEFARFGRRTRWGCRWKSQNRKNVYLSPYVEEPLNSKGIKSFVPELRSRYVFFEFRDSYVLSLWTFDVRLIHSHIMAMVQLFSGQLSLLQYSTSQCTYLRENMHETNMYRENKYASNKYVSRKQICIKQKICIKQTNMHQTNKYASSKQICIKQICIEKTNTHQTNMYRENKYASNKKYASSKQICIKQICNEKTNMHQTKNMDQANKYASSKYVSRKQIRI